MMIGTSPSLAKRARHVEAVQPRQPEVQDHEIRLLGPGAHQGLAARRRPTVTAKPAGSR